jgi:hypothetical protein
MPNTERKRTRKPKNNKKNHPKKEHHKKKRRCFQSVPSEKYVTNFFTHNTIADIHAQYNQSTLETKLANFETLCSHFEHADSMHLAIECIQNLLRYFPKHQILHTIRPPTMVYDLLHKVNLSSVKLEKKKQGRLFFWNKQEGTMHPNTREHSIAKLLLFCDMALRRIVGSITGNPREDKDLLNLHRAFNHLERDIRMNMIVMLKHGTGHYEERTQSRMPSSRPTFTKMRY